MNNNLITALILALVGLTILGCIDESYGKLPYYGRFDIVDGDTIHHKIRNFQFINQDSMIVTNETFTGQIYISDFFFTTCPTICPKVKQQMLRIAEKYQNEDRVKLLSHSIDTRRDSVPTLKKYANKLNISSNQWHLVTGNKKDLYDIAEDYFSIAKEDENAPGGYDHSGYLILIDQNRHLRAYCDGTDPTEVDKFMVKIDFLLEELERATQ